MAIREKPEKTQEEFDLEEARRSKSLLYRLWADAKALKQDLTGKSDDDDDDDGGGGAPSGTTPGQQPEPEPQTPSLAPRAGDLMKPEGNYLYQLHMGGVQTNAESVCYSDFMADASVPDKDQVQFFKDLQQEAKNALQHLSKNEKESAEKPALDARAITRVSPDKTRAFIFIFPAMNGGADITKEDVEKSLAQQNICFGVNQSLLEHMTANRVYMRMDTIAQGMPAVNAEDGRVVDHVPREKRFSLVESEDHTVDYKSLNWLHQIHAGDVICDIIPPTQAVDGVNVLGQTIHGRIGKKAIPPKGKNTSVNEDETALIADIDGQISYTGHKFQVDRLLVIKGDVDNSTGNLDVMGDVIINGDVREGFKVKASGNITIKGMVEGATIIAGGNIQVGAGMNGSYGVLDAQGDIQCKYLENCTVSARGAVTSDSIINSHVSSDDQVIVTFGRGVIIGGSVTALNRIDAKSIGNQSNRTTVLKLGSTPNILKEKGRLEDELKRIKSELDDMEKNLRFLERESRQSSAQSKLQSELKLKKSVQTLQKAKIEKQLRDIDMRSVDLSFCRITSNVIFPITQIAIGRDIKVMHDTAYNCNIYYSQGEIHIGTK